MRHTNPRTTSWTRHFNLRSITLVTLRVKSIRTRKVHYQRRAVHLRLSQVAPRSQTSQSLPGVPQRKTIVPTPKFASPTHPAGFISTPPSEFGSSPLPSPNDPFQTLQNYERGPEIPLTDHRSELGLPDLEGQADQPRLVARWRGRRGTND